MPLLLNEVFSQKSSPFLTPLKELEHIELDSGPPTQAEEFNTQEKGSEMGQDPRPTQLPSVAWL